MFTNGAFFDRSNPFFKSLGTNGRACVTWHVAQDGWTIAPESVQVRFADRSMATKFAWSILSSSFPRMSRAKACGEAPVNAR
ncbi:MAG: di-heme enzyme family [Chthonomonadaceae bacterium]|nr:di-heme enzyme family [Chthonomonadaceae bacterium]